MPWCHKWFFNPTISVMRGICLAAGHHKSGMVLQAYGVVCCCFVLFLIHVDPRKFLGRGLEGSTAVQATTLVSFIFSYRFSCREPLAENKGPDVSHGHVDWSLILCRSPCRYCFLGMHRHIGRCFAAWVVDPALARIGPLKHARVSTCTPMTGKAAMPKSPTRNKKRSTRDGTIRRVVLEVTALQGPQHTHHISAGDKQYAN